MNVESGENITTSHTSGDDIAQNPTSFAAWASSVGLALTTQGDWDEPDYLFELVEQSQIAPAWILQKLSPEYDYTRRAFVDQIEILAHNPTKLVTTSNGGDLSEGVKYALPYIFEVVSRATCLQRHQATRPSQADYRLVLDQLLAHIWNFGEQKEFLYRVECPIHVPSAIDPPFNRIQPNSTSFFQIDREVLTGMPVSNQEACSVLIPQDYIPWDYVLHSVTEYKPEAPADTTRRLVWMAMVSGLHQRRALGFKDQVVFGTVFHSTHQLDVYAGAWIDHTRLSESARVSTSSKNKISIHHLSTSSMTSTTSMLEFYLLNRLIRLKADEYRLSINQEARSRVLDGFEHRSSVNYSARNAVETSERVEEAQIDPEEEQVQNNVSVQDCDAAIRRERLYKLEKAFGLMLPGPLD